MVDLQAYSPFILICSISVIFVWVLFKSSTGSRYNLPPSPFGYLPIIGHLHLLGATPHQSFRKLSLKYGPVIRVYLGSVPCVVACTPEIAKEFLKTHESAYSDRPLNSAATYLSYDKNDFVFAPYGPYWKFMKKIVMSKLLNGTTVDLLYPFIHDEINRFINSISQSAKVGKAVNMEEELLKVTNNVLTRILMSERYSEDDDVEASKMRKCITEISETLGNFDIADYIPLFKNLDLQGFGKRVKDLRRRFDILMERIIKEHEQARKEGTNKVKDLLDILLDIAEDDTMEIGLTRTHIKAFILDVVGAGTETTAITIEWALAELINHPKVLRKAREEIDRVVGKNRLIQDTDINNLPYLEAIVKETLRLHPSVPLIPRKSAKECTVSGYHIEANATLLINVWAINKDANYWENPFEYKPERFLDVNLDVRGQNFHMLPFGSGRRMCPGTSLALQLVPLTIGAMIQCFDWKAGKDGNLIRVDMEEGRGLSVPRLHPLVCVPVARLNPIPLSADI